MKVYVERKTCKVFFMITYKGRRFQVYTGLQTTEKFNGMIFPRSDVNAKAKTARLAMLYAKVEEYILTHNETPGELKDRLKTLITGRPAKNDSNRIFLDYMDEFISTKLKPSTIRTYRAAQRSVSRYDSKATFEKMNKRWMAGYVAFCRGEGLCNNTILTRLTQVKAVFNWAEDNEYTTIRPPRKQFVRKEATRKRHLSLEQLRTLKDYPVSDFIKRDHETFRDIFMLCFYLIGINISDLLELLPSDLQNGRITYKRNKTGRLYDIKVEPEAQIIIDKYRGRKHLLKFLDKKITTVDNFTILMNKKLRLIGMKRTYGYAHHFIKGYDPLFPGISTYWSRHSWATIASSIDIPKETIGKALGHACWDRSVTDIYIGFDARKIDEANRKVIDWVVYGKK